MFSLVYKHSAKVSRPAQIEIGSPLANCPIVVGKLLCHCSSPGLMIHTFANGKQCRRSKQRTWRHNKTRLCWQPRTSSLYMTLPACDAKRGLQACQLSVDICCRRPRSAANPRAAAAAIDRLDRHTDGRTDTRPLHRPCFSYHASNVNKAARFRP